MANNPTGRECLDNAVDVVRQVTLQLIGAQSERDGGAKGVVPSLRFLGIGVTRFYFFQCMR